MDANVNGLNVSQIMIQDALEHILHQYLLLHYDPQPDLDPFIDQHPTHPNIIIGAGFSGECVTGGGSM